jgi:exodeoxyribonuclease VII large subunit
MRTLAAVSPLKTLERGYSITTMVDSGRVLHRADEAKPNQHINVRLGKGQLVCEIKEVKND